MNTRWQKKTRATCCCFRFARKGEEVDVNITAVKSTVKGLVLIIDRGCEEKTESSGVFFFNRGAPYNDFLLLVLWKNKNRILGLSDVDF